jgi:hypothetical protein
MLAKCANLDCSEHLRGNDFLPRSHSRYTNHRCMSDSGSAPALLLVITITRARDRSYITIPDEWGKLCHDGRGVR